MIKVNLISAPRERPKHVARVRVEDQVALVCGLILVVTVGLLGWWFWSLREASGRLDQDILAARQEAQRLQSVLQQVAQFETRKVQLQQRVTLIEELRKGQTGPVRMLDALSRSLPDRLWLIELSQAGAEVTVDGQTTSLTALSDFIGNLETSGFFQRPVEIVSSQVETQPQGELVRFSVKAQFEAPAP